MKRFDIWLCHWVSLVCDIIAILTYTYYIPNWYMQIVTFYAKRRLRRKYE